MSETEHHQEQEVNLPSLIHAFHKAKLELEVIKQSRKSYEKDHVETPEYIELRDQLKSLNKDLKAMKEAALEDLGSDSNYSDLRKLQMKHEEEFAHQRETVAVGLGKLPMAPIQSSFGFEGCEKKVDITTSKKLFINGKDQKI